MADPSAALASLFLSHPRQHALGDRARKIDQGILIVRFELPFNVWCGSCDGHLGAGVRFNAEKRKVGNYLSTPIYGFTCKCASCGGKFELRTDPKVRSRLVKWSWSEVVAHSTSPVGTASRTRPTLSTRALRSSRPSGTRKTMAATACMVR